MPEYSTPARVDPVDGVGAGEPTAPAVTTDRKVTREGAAVEHGEEGDDADDPPQPPHDVEPRATTGKTTEAGEKLVLPRWSKIAAGLFVR